MRERKKRCDLVPGAWHSPETPIGARVVYWRGASLARSRKQTRVGVARVVKRTRRGGADALFKAGSP